MPRKAPRGATPALDALVAAGIDHEVRAYDHDEATTNDIGYGLEAARKLGLDPARVFKTLMVEVGGGGVLAVVPVAGRLDLKAVARERGAKKASLMPAEAAERLSGSVVGAISPVACRSGAPVMIDGSALDQATVLVSAGRRGLDVEIAPDDLVRVTGAQVAPIARDR